MVILKKNIIISIFLVSLVLQVVAAESGGPGYDPASEKWKVGVSQFRDEGLSPEHLHFTYDIPKKLVDYIRQCPTHFLSDEEIQALGEQLKKEKMRELQTKLHQLLERRATEFIEQKNAAEKETLRKLERELEEQREKILSVEETPPREENIGSQRDCVSVPQNTENELFEGTNLPLSIWMKERDLDCLITGTLEPLDELLYVEVEAYLRATDRRITLFRGSFFPHENEEIVADVSYPLRSFLYGKEWSDIALKITPPTAEVHLDGSVAPIDERGLVQYIVPGLHSLEVKAPGYKSEQKLVETENRSIKVVTIELEKADPRTWVIGSEPHGADVYIDSVRKGETPLVLKKQVAPASVLIRKDGYSDRFLVMEENKNHLRPRLHPEVVDIDRVVESARSRFYQGLAAFLLSLPLTVVSYGQSNEYANAYNSALTKTSIDTRELERLRSRSTLWYTAYAGSMILNTVFLTDTILSMRHYIKSSQEY